MTTVTQPRHFRTLAPLRYVHLLSILLLLACTSAGAAAASQATHINLTARHAPNHAIWVGSLDLAYATQGWGTTHAGKSVGGHPIRLGNKIYPHGIGTHANGEIDIDLRGGAKRFLADVGVDQEAGHRGSVRFIVDVDGKQVVKTPVLRGGDKPRRIELNLTGAREMRLIVTDAGDGNTWDHADWAGAMLILNPSKNARPFTLRPPRTKPIIAIGSPAAPAIHGPRVVGSTPGRPFLFRIPATGQGVLHFQADNLPAGLRLNADTGIIRGSLKADGVFVVDLTVRSAIGQTQRKLIIVGGRHMLALTPPMGWNSWNVWATHVNAQRVLAAAKAMVRSGLAAHGYQFVNIDDGWPKGRNTHGQIVANKKFSNMKALGRSIHSMGLKFGIYSSPGPTTCAGYTGSYQHELQDAKTWASWGVDYLKYDWCSYGIVFTQRMAAWRKAHPHATSAQRQAERIKQYQHPYAVMRTALDHVDRDIVYSLCQYGMGDVWKWGNSPTIRANLWRTTGDIGDTWASMTANGFSQSPLHTFAGPGHWNDPDMLVVGQLGWFGHPHPTQLTPNEQLTHISLWSMLSAPLLIGCDMTQLRPFTRAILMNDEVLALDQDPLGIEAWRVQKKGETEVWKKPLWDGTTAVALFNRGPIKTKITVAWSTLKLRGPQPVRNLWRHENLGVYDKNFSAMVPAHGVVLVKIGRPMPTDKAIHQLVRRYRHMISRPDN